MTKEEVIQQAYREYWDGFNNTAKKCALSNNGYISPILENAPEGIELDYIINGAYRPKSLQGIENNNGWIKIESEKDLPKEYDLYNACWFNKKFKDDIPMFYGCNLPDLRNYFDEELITHYQPIEKRKPPIY
jgi:hypothetical protein